MKVFISHSSKNQSEALEICRLIESHGHSCFYAPRDIRSGCEYAEELVNGIDSSHVMLLLLSKDSNSSPHVLREVERAVSKKISIVVYKLEEVELSKSMEYFLMTHQWINEKSDTSYSEIISCLDDIAASHSGSDDKAIPLAEEKSAAVPADDAPEKRLPIPAIIGISAVAVALIIGGIILINSGGDNDSDVQPETSPVCVTGESLSTQGTTGTTGTVAISTPFICVTGESLSGGSDTVREPTEQTEQTTPPTRSEPSELPPTAVTLAELGDTITMGSYLGEPIQWRVIDISDDGRSAMVIAQNILTMKCFDAAEGGKFNFYDGEYYWSTPLSEMSEELQRLTKGSNSWEDSNIRLWLNSDRENVQYIGQAPTQQAMSELSNGYNTEAGFLRSFTDEELSAILTTQVITNGKVTEDKVFLLSKDELELLYRADVSKYALPTDTAVKQDTSRWYELNQNDFGIMDHYWWLRDANTDTANECYLINTSYSSIDIFTASAGLEGYGIRPVMTIDLSALAE